MSQPSQTSEKKASRNVPRHVAIIMDGNGRWALSRGLERSAGHVQGVETVRSITRAAAREGIDFLTLYAFSTENWNRPREEVDALMHLMVLAVERETPELLANNVRLLVIGDMERLPEETRTRLQGCIDRTAADTGLTLVLAISYSSRWEIVRAARSLGSDIAAGRLRPEDIDDSVFSSRLSTSFMPDPDLLIRTGGDMRLSNFLLWQMAYGELYVTDTYWPDFTPRHLHEAIEQYSSRERRYGLTSGQIKGATPPDR